MRVLWLIAVGNTDVQFPVRNAQGLERRYEIPLRASGRSNSTEESPRIIHEELLRLVRAEQLAFPCYDFIPDRQELGKLALTPDGLRFLSNDEDCDLARQKGDPSECVPVLCPKLEPLIKLFATVDEIAVLAINTSRDSGDKEVLAAGPVAAKFVSERKSIKWIDGTSNESRSSSFTYGSSTWVDVLIEDERLEENEQRVVERIDTFLAELNELAPDRVIVTTSGGLPPLKELPPIVASRWFGRGKVELCNATEGGQLIQSSFSRSRAEIESLRLQATEGLSSADIFSALGAASATLAIEPECHWAKEIQWFGRRVYGVRASGKAPSYAPGLPKCALIACRIESDLANGEDLSAISQLGTLIENLAWDFLKEILLAYGLEVNLKDARKRIIPKDHTGLKEIISRNGMREKRGYGGVGDYTIDRNEVKILLSGPALTRWCNAVSLGPLITAYDKVRPFRNIVVHDGNLDVLPQAMKVAREEGLVGPPVRIFGQNLLKPLQHLTPSIAWISKLVSFHTKLWDRTRGRLDA